LGSITITHCFHPLFGKSFSILKIREIHGLRNYSLLSESGVLSVPESWTDRYNQQIFSPASDKLRFNAYDLKELAQFLQKYNHFF
jgi:Family of unknown function (DUF5372)